MKKRHLIAAAILVAVVAVVIAIVVQLRVDNGSLTERVSSEQMYDGHQLRGWSSVKRWTDPPIRHGEEVLYYVDTGFIAIQTEWKSGNRTKKTHWNPDGTVTHQWVFVDDSGHAAPVQLVESPPWLWGVTDQTEPTAPWWGKE